MKKIQIKKIKIEVAVVVAVPMRNKLITLWSNHILNRKLTRMKIPKIKRFNRAQLLKKISCRISFKRKSKKRKKKVRRRQIQTLKKSQKP